MYRRDGQSVVEAGKDAELIAESGFNGCFS